MDRRLYLLREISENNRISQRQLAKKINLSLGTINALMQQLEKEDWIDSKIISGKVTEYKLTNTGKYEKAKLSKDEAVHCYQFIGEVKNIIKQNLEKWLKLGFKHYVIIGQEDEIFRLVKLAVKDLSRFNKMSYELMESVEGHTYKEKNKYVAWDNQHIAQAGYVSHILEIE